MFEGEERAKEVLDCKFISWRPTGRSKCKASKVAW